MTYPLHTARTAVRLAALALVFIVPLALGLMPGRARAAGTIRYVATSGADSGTCDNPTAPCATLQFAVNQSTNGDEIRIAAGTYTDLHYRNYEYNLAYITRALQIRGGYSTADAFATSDPDANPTILDAQDNGRILYFNGVDGDVANLTVQGGWIEFNDGGGILASGSLTLTRVTVNNSWTDSGGGGAMVFGNALVVDSLFTGNKSTAADGGGIKVSGTAIISRTLFDSNSASSVGGGAYLAGPAFLYAVTFVNNEADSGGGAHLIGDATVYSATVVNNRCCIYTGNSGGGGLHTEGALTVTHSVFEGNTAIDYDDTGHGTGGAIQISYGPVLISDTLFANNTASGYVDDGGGAIAAYGALAVVNSAFISNTSASNGAAVSVNNAATLSMLNTRLTGNAAAAGALALRGDSAGALTGTLFARNIMTGSGATIYHASTGELRIVQATIASPVMAGTAIYLESGAAAITNTIVATHTTAISVAGGVVSEDYNLFFGNGANTAGTLTSGGHSFDGDPAFVNPAADDYHLRLMSAAIDRGADGGPATDIDGGARPQGSRWDIGYDEFPGGVNRLYLPAMTR